MRRRTWAPATVVALVVLAATGGAVVAAGSKDATPDAQEPSANTVKVQRGELRAMVSLGGTLTYRGRPDGSPYSVINQARGTYTELPEVGAKVDCGDVLYRVDDHPVLLLCGTVPVYRDLHEGDVGRDVRQLNRNLHQLGYDHRAGVDLDPDDDDFTWRTQATLERLQHARGLDGGGLDAGDAVFLPRSVRIAKVTGELGGLARPGGPVAQATSTALEVQVELEASRQGEVREGDRVQITLPGNRSEKGTVDRLGSVAQIAGKEDADVGNATIPAFIRLDDPETARRLDRAPVQVDITTKGVASALSVPVTALVGKSGGGLAVEVVRAGGRRELVAVRVGLFDTANGRVEVKGDLRAGDRVAVPSL